MVAFEEYRAKLIDAPPPLQLGTDTNDGINPDHMWDYDLQDLSQFAILHQVDRMPKLAEQIREKYRLE